MKRNLLEKSASDELVNRVNNLTPAHLQRWGEMTATEMLLHCNICNRQILTEGRGESQTTVKQYLLRILALYFAPHFKRGIRSEPRNITKGKTDDTHFDELREEFIQIIQTFPQHKKPMTLTHPAFGNISTHEWGIAAYKNMDHHLRQFGV